MLCGKDVNTVARWESGAIKPPLDYTVELRMKGGVEFFDWVRESAPPLFAMRSG